MTTELVIKALEKAIQKGLIKAGAIVHTDRGGQYASKEFRAVLQRHSFRQSILAKGNCCRQCSSGKFFSRFKAELIEGGIFESVKEARSEVFSYIEGYYNRVRLHSGLGYKTPLKYELEIKIKEETKGVLCPFLLGHPAVRGLLNALNCRSRSLYLNAGY